MTAKGPHEGGMHGGLEGRGFGALSVCTLQQEIAGKVTGALTQDGAPEVSMSCLPPDPSLVFCLAKTDESTTSHLLSYGWPAGAEVFVITN